MWLLGKREVRTEGALTVVFPVLFGAPLVNRCKPARLSQLRCFQTYRRTLATQAAVFDSAATCRHRKGPGTGNPENRRERRSMSSSESTTPAHATWFQCVICRR